MFFNTRKISLRLVLFIAISFHHASARSVKPITFGYELGSPSNDLLPLVSDQDLDLSISAAEPRPVFVELVKRPLSLPLVADVGAISAASVAPVLSASEKIEKVLRRPMAFSYNTDQANAESSLIINSPKEALKTDESKLRLDQQPDAIDYYKYIARLQADDKDGGADVKKDISETKKEKKEKKEDKSSKKHGIAKEEKKKDSGDMRDKAKPNLFLSYSPSSFHHEYNHKQPASGFKKTVKDEPEHKSEESKEESQKSKSDDHGSHTSHTSYESLFVPKFKLDDSHKNHQQEEAGGKAEASESHEEHKQESSNSDQGGHSDSHQSGSEGGQKHEEVKEEAQASASHHGDGGGGGGNFKKGGTKEYKSENIGDHGKDGEKKYSGHHEHIKSEKGHKDKLGHTNHYTEDEGHKHGHHDEDGYEAENHHGEDGKRGTEFHEEGEHSKGHSTQGEHNVHKKDEYEKKHEFYDESHEGGEHEKHGEYFHEDDYHKGGHHKSEHKKGGEHEEHYGKKKKHEEGGHEHEDQGHKKASGHDAYHEHEEKEGAEGKKQGGEKWKYEKGASEGHQSDSKGAHQHITVIVKDGKAEASDHKEADKVEDSKGADYHVREITDEKKPQEENQGHNRGHQAQASEEYGDHGERHGQHNHEAYSHDGELDGHHGRESNEEQDSHSDHYSRLEGGHGDNAQIQNEDANEEKQHQGFEDASYGHFHGAEARPQQVEKRANEQQKNSYGGDSFVHLLHDHARAEDLRSLQKPKYLQHPQAEGLEAYGTHVHPNGHICPGGSHTHAAQESQEPAKSENESHQGEESTLNRHILVLGNDGKIYSVLSNGDSIDGLGV